MRMSLIKVDSEKCSRDGICVEVCPLGLLSLDPEGMPEMRPGSARLLYRVRPLCRSLSEWSIG